MRTVLGSDKVEHCDSDVRPDLDRHSSPLVAAPFAEIVRSRGGGVVTPKMRRPVTI